MPLKYRIHPAIGIARVGDSPDDYFIGPEAPGISPTLKKPDVTSLLSRGRTRMDSNGSSDRVRVFAFTNTPRMRRVW